jgi:hypothetical protein
LVDAVRERFAQDLFAEAFVHVDGDQFGALFLQPLGECNGADARFAKDTIEAFGVEGAGAAADPQAAEEGARDRDQDAQAVAFAAHA